MFLIDWIRQYYEMKLEFAERRRGLQVCESCETLKQMNDHLRMDNDRLLRRILEKPTEPEQIREAPQVSLPKSIPWNIRRQMLEKEDREKARLMREAPKPRENIEMEEIGIKEFEKELANAERAREEQINR
jgi:hypothetical protein